MKTVLVTGASTGLGLALSELLIGSTDFHLVLTAREESIDRFTQEGITESERVWIRPLDVTVASQREDRVKEINDLLGGVDILINNAGIACRAVARSRWMKCRSYLKTRLLILVIFNSGILKLTGTRLDRLIERVP